MKFSPYLATQVEHNSNVFALSNAERAVAENGESTRDDTILRYLAGATAGWRIGAQSLHGTVEGRRFDYLHFSRLDHNEYLLDAGLDWIASSALTGAVDYRQERRMAAFADRPSTQLAFERDRAVGTRVNLLLTPEWLLQGGVKNHELDSPIQGSPAFGLSENSVNAAISYLNIDPFSAGLYGEYLRGEYRGAVGGGKFDQATFDVTGTYIISGLSDVNAKLGYTQRKDQQGGSGSVSGVTGSLSYAREISAKTAAKLRIFRGISSYTAGSNSVVETGVSASLNWQPTYKILVSAEYAWSNSAFQGNGASGMDNANRRDRFQVTTLKVKYHALDWLWVEPYAGYQDRKSNIDNDGYNAAIIGIDVRAQLGEPPSSPSRKK